MKSKFLTAILSLLVSFGLWLYVISVVSPGSENTYYNIPVNIQNESLLTDRGLMITENKNPTVTLHLVGDRVDLNKLNSSNITITVDASRIYEAGRRNLSYDITYPGDIADDAISVQSRSTSTISLIIEERVSKPVNVVVEYTGQLSADYICDKENAVFTNEVVNIVGPKSVTDQITQAKIQVDLTDRTQTISQDFPYTLCREDGEPVDEKKLENIRTDVESVGLTVNIQRVKEIPLRLNVISGGGATEKTTSIVMQQDTIRVSGSEAQLESLSVLELGTVDLGKLTEATVLIFPIVLPEGITNETGLTEISVDIQFPDLAMKKLNVTNIVAVNTPPGYEVEMITQQLEITVRGPAALVDALTAEDVTVQVDFLGAQIGTSKLKAKIVMSQEFAAIGAMDSYSVSAILREPIPENSQSVIDENGGETVKG